MTLEQAIQSIELKKSQIIQLESEINSTIDSLKKLTPFKYGDKVKATERSGKETICYISDVEYVSWGRKYEYKLNKVKNDGTMSGQSAGIYYADKVEAA